MQSFLPTYGTTLGPVGIPMRDDHAFALDAIFKQLPAEDQRLRKAAIPAALLSLEPGERSDISWITTESIDRDKEIVLAAGMRDAHFLHNPLVTLNHCYDLPPVGRCVGLTPAPVADESPTAAPTTASATTPNCFPCVTFFKQGCLRLDHRFSRQHRLGHGYIDRQQHALRASMTKNNLNRFIDPGGLCCLPTSHNDHYSFFSPVFSLTFASVPTRFSASNFAFHVAALASCP